MKTMQENHNQKINNYIPIIEENPDKSYTISRYVSIPKITYVQFILLQESIIENLEEEYFKELEKEHKKLFPKLTDKEWLGAFPEAIEDYIRPKIIELKKQRQALEIIIPRELEIIREKSKPKNQWFWEMVVAFLEGEDLMEVEKQIAHFKYLLSIATNEPVKYTGRITDEMIEGAKSKPIENIVGPIVKLKKSGKNLIGLCPFHKEKTPSFYLYHDTNSFYCFGCQKGGNVITFVKEYYNLDFKEAIKYLNNN